MEKEILISLIDIKKSYMMGEVAVEALKKTTVDIFKNELLVVLGPSGSGKSTLLNLMGGMDKPTAGQIIYKDKDISHAGDNELTLYRRRDVGFVFQFYNLIPDLTAEENISLAAELVDSSLNVEEVLKDVELGERKNHFPAQMSGGEQQRVSIARAIVKKPQILLCDEPTGALDFQTGKLILALLKQINREKGSTVIIVTHNSAIAGMADRVLKMRSGNIIEIINNSEPLDPERINW